jgi:succinate dehydrogenase / fumarate reductase cytochrome b subunit
MAAQQRPLSPHLTVYKLPLAARLSILHRGTGVFLSLAAFGLVLWLLAASGTESDYARFLELSRTWPAKLFVLGAIFSLALHFFTGLRHLLWDIGWGLELKSTLASNWIVVILAGISTVVLAWLAYFGPGAGA